MQRLCIFSIHFLAREFVLGMLLTVWCGAGGESAGSVGLGTEGVAVGGEEEDEEEDDDDDDDDDDVRCLTSDNAGSFARVHTLNITRHTSHAHSQVMLLHHGLSSLDVSHNLLQDLLCKFYNGPVCPVEVRRLRRERMNFFLCFLLFARLVA